MFHDPLVQKAWEIHNQVQCFPIETILKATVWLEERQCESPDWKTASTIAIQYLVLAMRQESEARVNGAGQYFSLAALWREEAIRQLNK